MPTARMGIITNTLRRVADLLIESPCIAVCKMDDATGLCKGCFRTIDEIALWPEMNGEEKREVIASSARRRAAAKN